VVLEEGVFGVEHPVFLAEVADDKTSLEGRHEGVVDLCTGGV
jgi:hypothetical protein